MESISAQLEARWSDAIGRDRVERLRDDLVTVLTAPDGELPPVRPTW